MATDKCLTNLLFVKLLFIELSKMTKIKHLRTNFLPITQNFLHNMYNIN